MPRVAGARRRQPTLHAQLRGAGLSESQIARVPKRHHRALLRHVRSGSAFTDFFTKTLKHGFEDAGNKIKDAFTQKVKLPDPIKKIYTGLRDYVNPAIAKIVPAIIEKIPIPGSNAISTALEKASEGYLHLVPPENGPFKGSGRRAGMIPFRAGMLPFWAGMIGHKPVKGMYNVMGAGRRAGARRAGARSAGALVRHCGLCGSAGATVATCPMNPAAAHRRHSRHPMAKMM